MPAGDVAVVLGTRPEIIKMAPVIHALEAAGMAHRIVHTNQHYSPALDRVFFEELGLAPAGVNLGVGSASHGAQTGRMLAALEATLAARPPACVLVEGDTNSVLAGALAAAKMAIPVGHVEAGLRSGDRTMPEELNRIVADHLASWLFAPTAAAVRALRAEGRPEAAIALTGNTVVDATLASLERAERREAPARFGLTPRRYLLLTLHRAENTDSRARLEGVLSGLEAVAAASHLPILFPVHPRTEQRLGAHGLLERLDALAGMRRVAPVGFLDFLGLERQAACILTDSGGVQEEACILGTPCVTLRDSTERPETLEVGANRLAGTRSEAIAAGVRQALSGPSGPSAWPNPFGDGRAGERIVAFLCERLAG